MELFNKRINAISDLALGMSTSLYIENLFKGKSIQEILTLDSVKEWKKAMTDKLFKAGEDTEIIGFMGFSKTFERLKEARLKEARENNASDSDDIEAEM